MEKIESPNENQLGTQPIGGLLRSFAIPSIIAMLVGALYNMVDQIFIGQKIGELGNAATNVAFPLSTAAVAVALLLGIGGAAAYNLALGSGDKERAVNYVGNGIVLMIIFGTILGIASLIFLEPMLRLFGSPDNVLGYAITYTRISAFGFPFLVASIGGGHLIRADGSPKYAMFCNLSGAIINTILDPIFIFGFDMDMAGAALATIIGQAFSFGMAMWYFYKFRTVPLRKRHLFPKWKYTGRIFALGAAPAFNQIAMMVVQIVMNNSLVFYGATSKYGESIPLAASGIINKVAMIFFAVIIGISQGMQPIAGYNYGAKKFDRVKEVYKLAIKYSLIISITTFLSFQIFPKQIISLFGSGSHQYFEFATSYFRIFMFFTFINFIQPVSSTFFTSIGKPKRGVFLSLTRQIIFFLPLIVVLPIFLGIDGIMFAGPVADFVAAAVATFMMIKEFKNLNSDAEILE